MLFAMLMTFHSGVGQTFLVSLFIPHMRDAFHFSQTQISGFYSLATLASAFLLPFWGHLLDRISLRKFVAITGLLLAAGCFTLSRAAGALSVLAGFLIVRNLGQGTFAMTASTIMAKVFGPARGKALSISNLGFPLSEALLPLIITAWIIAHGWRSGWLVLGLLVALIFLPLAYLLLRGAPHVRAQHEHEKLSAENQKLKASDTHQVRGKDWTPSQVLKDWRFYVIQFPCFLTPGFLTALFFHQAALISWKPWDMRLMAAAFIAFAAFRALFALVTGPLIDRYSARRLFPLSLTPLACGILCFLSGNHPAWAFVYLGFAGMTIGMGMTVKGALWAEFYGVKYLGSIRGIQGSLIVFATAVTPVLVGKLLDMHIPVQTILQGMIFCIAAGVVTAYAVCGAKKL